MVFAGPASNRIFVLQIAKLVVLTGPAADEIWELHSVRFMVWPVWDNPGGQLPGTGIRSDAENLYSGNLYRGSAPGVSGASSGSASCCRRVSLWWT